MSAVMRLAQCLQDITIKEVLSRCLHGVMHVYRRRHEAFIQTFWAERFFEEDQCSESMLGMAPAACAIEPSQIGVGPGPFLLPCMEAASA